MSTELSRVSQSYLAYPVLQYYHAAKSDDSPELAVALFDEALSIIRFGVPERNRPSAAIMRSARSSMETFLDTLPAALVEPAPNAPPPPDLSELKESGIPTVSDEQFKMAEIAERRRLLLGTVRNDGWEWTEK